MSSDTDASQLLVRHFREIVLRICGEPNQKLSSKDELRYGKNGSLSVQVSGDKAGTWYDHENQRGGGVLDFLWIYADVKEEAAWEWLKREIGIGDDNGGRRRKRSGEKRCRECGGELPRPDIQVICPDCVEAAGARQAEAYSREAGRSSGNSGDFVHFWDGNRGIGGNRDRGGRSGRPPAGQQKIATYTYVDERGGILFWVYRYGPQKRFSQAQPGPDKGGIKRKSEDGKPTMQGCRYVPYHLDQLAAAAGAGTGWRVYVVEGEKDADRLIAEWGVVATCNAGGAGKWHSSYTPFFAGADVVIIADNDDAGRSHAHYVGEKLARVAYQVRILELGDLDEKGDISDWIDAGGTQSDLETLIEELLPLAGNAPTGPRFNIQEGNDVVRRPVDWLWHTRIARGKLSLIAGHPGLGKSTIALDLAARLTRGARWPDYSIAPEGRVLLFSLEDTPDDVILPRFDAMDGDASRLSIVQGIPDVDEDGLPLRRAFSIRKDCERLADEIKARGDVVAVIIDPISAYLGEDADGRMIDSHKTADVRAVLTPFQEMASRLNVAIIGVAHLKKSSEGDAILQVSGSLGFVAAARAVFLVIKDQAEPRRRMFLCAKNNLADDSSGFAYRIEVVELASGPAAKIAWEADPIDKTADEMIAEQRAAQKRAERKAGAEDKHRLEKDFIKAELELGSIAEKLLRDRGRSAGYTWPRLLAAIGKLGAYRVLVEREPDVWGYQLPTD